MKLKNRITKFLETACRTAQYLYCREGKAGIIAVLETSGDRMNFNVHVHMLITECVAINGGMVGKGDLEDTEGIDLQDRFKPLPKVPFLQVNRLWRNKILALLVNTERISSAEAEDYKRRCTKGFIVYHVTKPLYDSREEAKRIAAYLLKPSVTERKIVRYDENKKEVLIRFKYGVSELKRNIYRHETLTVDEFIRRTIQHILPSHVRKVRYLGLYSSRYRGMVNRERGIKP